jgi:hypothetical protein
MRLSTYKDIGIFSKKLKAANIELPENLVLEFTAEENKSFLKNIDGINIMGGYIKSVRTQFHEFKIK